MIYSPDAQWLLSMMHKAHNQPTLADIERFCELVAKLCADGEELQYARLTALYEIIND